MALQYEVLLAPDPTEAGRARAALTDVLLAWGLDVMVDDAVLVVSELVANAILHTRAPVMLRIFVHDDGVLHLDVSDTSPKPPQRRAATPHDVNGRGLELVDILADRWGWHARDGGKDVWAEMTCAGL